MVIWPTIWIWIWLLRTKVINAHDQILLLSEEQLKIEQTRYTVLVQVPLFFLEYHKPDKERPAESMFKQLSTLVENTDRVLQMISTLWIEEGKEGWAIMGFPLCNMYSTSLTHARSEIELQIKQLIIADRSGSTEEVAKLAFHRVANHLHWSHWQASETGLNPDTANRSYKQMTHDTTYVHMHMSKPSSALCGAFRVHTGCVTLFVDVLFHRLMLHDPVTQSVLFLVSIQIILLKTTKVQPYSGFLELLETPFLDFVIQARLITSSYSAQHQGLVNLFSHCNDVLLNMEYFCVFRPILSRISQGFKSAAEFMNRSDIPTAVGLLELWVTIVQLLKVYETYKCSPPPIFYYGSRQVILCLIFWGLTYLSPDYILSVIPQTMKALSTNVLAVNLCSTVALSARNKMVWAA